MSLRIIRMFPVAALAAALLALLTACGGGGGGGSSTQSFTPTAREAALVAAPSEAVAASEATARTTPRFGSVRQTARVGSVATVTGVDITRQADGEFDIVIRRAGEGRTVLNTATHDVGRQIEDSPTGRTAQSGTLLTSDRTRITAAAGLVDYDPDDLGDWMLAGYWLHIEGDLANGTVTGAEVGAFFEGPEFVDNSVPVSGTATYRGLAGGLYTTRYGTDTATSTAPTGTHEIGDYRGTFRATADFAAGTVSGEITDIRLAGIGVTPTGRLYDFNNVASPARLVLESTSLDSGRGRVEGTARLEIPGYTFTSQQGSWGSRLSNQDDSSGNPRALGGTHAGSGQTAGGTVITYVGAHGGATGDFD